MLQLVLGALQDINTGEDNFPKLRLVVVLRNGSTYGASKNIFVTCAINENLITCAINENFITCVINENCITVQYLMCNK
jgi:hypothetical protein